MGATIHHALTRRDPRLEPPFSFAERPIRRINPSVSPELEVIVNRLWNMTLRVAIRVRIDMKEALTAVARKTGVLVRMGVNKQDSVAKASGIKPLWTFKSEDEIRGTPTISQGSLYIGSYDNNLYAVDAADGKFQWKYPTDGGDCLPARR